MLSAPAGRYVYDDDLVHSGLKDRGKYDQVVDARYGVAVDPFVDSLRSREAEYSLQVLYGKTGLTAHPVDVPACSSRVDIWDTYHAAPPVRRQRLYYLKECRPAHDPVRLQAFLFLRLVFDERDLMLVNCQHGGPSFVPLFVYGANKKPPVWSDKRFSIIVTAVFWYHPMFRGPRHPLVPV